MKDYTKDELMIKLENEEVEVYLNSLREVARYLFIYKIHLINIVKFNLVNNGEDYGIIMVNTYRTTQ